MEKYKWVPQSDDGTFINGEKWEYFRGKVKLARIVRFSGDRQVAAGKEHTFDEHWLDTFSEAAKFVEENYK